MRQVTNLQLLHAAVVVILLVGLAIAFESGSDGGSQPAFYLVFVGLGILVTAAMSFLVRTLGGKKSIWSQPVSGKVGSILMNGVVSLWLCLVGLIVLLVLVARRDSPAIVITVLLSVVGGVGIGRLLQKRFRINSLLPYGISFFGALVLIMVAFVVVGR